MGKKTWAPGKHLQTFISGTFNVQRREQIALIERIATAMTEVGTEVRDAMERHSGFEEIGKRMLRCWSDSMTSLCDQRTYDLGTPDLGNAFRGMSDASPVVKTRTLLGRSEGLAKR